MKKAILLVFLTICANVPTLLAQNATISSSWELGKISTSEILEEEDISSDLTYYKYRFALKQKLSPQLDLGLYNTYYRKTFDSQAGLSNHSNQGYLSLNYRPESCYSLVPDRLSLKYLNKEKYYEALNRDKYYQNKIELGALYEKENNWQLALESAVNDFRYNTEDDKDETQYFFNTSARKYLFDEKLTLSALSKIKYLKRKHNNNREQYIWGGEASFSPGIPCLKNVSASIQKGQMETLDEDERDDKYDYKYTSWQVRSSHDITASLETALKLQRMKREYDGWNKSWKRILFENNTQFKLIDSKTADLALNLKLYHKRIDFPLSKTSNFDKNGAALELKFNHKKNYKLTGGFGWNKKRAALSPLKNRDAYTWKLSLEKTIASFVLSLDYRHELKDYEYAYDRTYDVFKFGAEYKF